MIYYNYINLTETYKKILRLFLMNNIKHYNRSKKGPMSAYSRQSGKVQTPSRKNL